MDYGLLEGLGNGLKEGLMGYREGRDASQKAALLRRQQQVDELTKGYSTDDDGNVMLTPQSMQKRDLESRKTSEELAGYDPNSQTSQRERSYYRGLLDQAKPGLGSKSIPDDLSANELRNKNSLLEPVLKGVYGAEGRQIVADRIGRGLDIKDRNQTEKENVNAGKVGQSYESDHILQGLKKTTNSIDRALSIAEGKLPITSQNFAMLQQDLINAVAPGGAATEGKTNREMTETLASKLNELQTKFGNVKDLRREQPQIFAQLVGLMKQVKQDYATAKAEQARNIHESYLDSTNPKVQETNKRKLKAYAPEVYEELYGKDKSDGDRGLLTTAAAAAAPQSPAAHPQDSEAVEWAKNPGSPGWTQEKADKILSVNGVK